MLEVSIIISLCVLVIHASMWEGMLFEKLGLLLFERVPEWAHKPAFDCLICMTPWYGMVICAFIDAIGIIDYSIKFYPILVITATGINVIIDCLIGFINDNRQ